MDPSVIIAVASLSIAVVINVVMLAFGYGRINQKVNDTYGRLAELTKDTKEMAKKVARIEGLLDGQERRYARDHSA